MLTLIFPLTVFGLTAGCCYGWWKISKYYWYREEKDNWGIVRMGIAYLPATLFTMFMIKMSINVLKIIA